MQLQPVKRYTAPKYPALDYLLEHPELLRLVPRRWQGNKLVLATLSAVALLLSCAHTQPSLHESPGATTSMTAPLFPHGGGVGAFGCVVINPPVFLTEDEARSVICTEARRAGIHFVPDETDSSVVDLPFTERSGGWPLPIPYVESPAGSTLPNDSAYEAWQRREAAPRTIHFDGTDKTRHIRYVYVNYPEYRDWKQPPPPRKVIVMSSTVTHVDILKAAETLQEALSRTAAEADSVPEITAVFYEPLEKGDSRDRTAARRYSKDALYRQVHDFIHWLKAEGII